MRSPALPALALLIACGGSKYDAADTAAYADTAEAPPGDASTEPPGAEDEDPLLRHPPAQTAEYVFVASPERDTVTRIHAATHELRTVAVGSMPRLVRTTPDHARALVLNRGDHTLSVLDAHTLDHAVVPVRRHLNQMALSPDGRFVALWHDPRAVRPDDPPPEGSQSFNEVSLVDLSDLSHHPMAVGYDPHEVQFTADSSLAVVVSDDALAVVDLGQRPLLPQMVPLSAEVQPPRAEEMVLSTDAHWGFLRQQGVGELLVVDLAERSAFPVPVGSGPTDLDITPDGTSAVAVARESRELWIYDLSDPTASPKVLGLPGTAPYGQITFAPGGHQALLFTNAAPTDRIAVWDTKTDAITERKLVKPVRDITVDPTGGTALVFHAKEDLPDAPPSPFTGRWALTLLALSDLRTNPLLLPGEPTDWAASDDGARAYFVMESQPWLEVVHFDTLLYDEIRLPSLPVFVGILPGADAPTWVSQQHDLGRISFYEHGTGALETLTGFELNSAISP